MSKFALLALFLLISYHWIHQPFEINPADDRIDQYRPSIHNEGPTVQADSTFALETSLGKRPTALHFPKAMISIQ